MSKSLTLTIPDEVYEAIVEAANTEGESPQEWIISQLPTVKGNGSHPQQSTEVKPAQTLAEAMKNYIGSVRSNSPMPLSENTGKAFTDYLEEKRREGKL